MSVRKQAAATPRVADLITAMERIAPADLAQDWDNVGLIAGDPAAYLRRAMLCIDLTRAVADEGLRQRVDLILAYHPPVFKAISRVRADSTGTDAIVFHCVRHGISIYSPHTALDAAEGGTNDAIANLCDAVDVRPLAWQDPADPTSFKLAVFLPASHMESLAGAMFEAGAGQIGDYSHCSFRVAGKGTFLGGESTDPTIGKRGNLEKVDEIRVETVVPRAALPAVVRAMLDVHPYEEPAFDLYPLTAPPRVGIGRVAQLPRPVALASLARKLRKATQAPCVQIVGPADRVVDRAVIVVGAAGSLPFSTSLTPQTVVITGEIRHHDALTIERIDATAVALGHFSSERPALAPLAHRLRDALPRTKILISEADREPFRPV